MVRVLKSRSRRDSILGQSKMMSHTDLLLSVMLLCAQILFSCVCRSFRLHRMWLSYSIEKVLPGRIKVAACVFFAHRIYSHSELLWRHPRCCRLKESTVPSTPNTRCFYKSMSPLMSWMEGTGSWSSSGMSAKDCPPTSQAPSSCCSSLPRNHLPGSTKSTAM